MFEPGTAGEDFASHTVRAGPFERFRVAFPPGWSAFPSTDGALLRMLPAGRASAVQEAASRTPLSLEHLLALDGAPSLTFAPHPVPIDGPASLHAVLDELCRTRGLTPESGRPSLSRWGEDAWLGTVAWAERQPDLPLRRAWVAVYGHGQGLLVAFAIGPRARFDEQQATITRILSTVRLAPATTLAPEFFGQALCERLNDRHGPGTEGVPQPWSSVRDGLEHQGGATVHLPALYRSYLLHTDLDRIASAVEGAALTSSAPGWALRTWAEARPHVRLVLRRGSQLSGLDVFASPVGADLFACPVLDSTDHLSFIPRAAAGPWGVSQDSLIRLAVDSLDGRGEIALDLLVGEHEEDLIGVRLPHADPYATGLLLSPALRESLVNALGPSPIVALPADDSVWILRDGPSERRWLEHTARRDFARRPRPISQDLYRWSDLGLEALPRGS